MKLLSFLVLVIGVNAACTVITTPGPGCKTCLANICLACHDGYYLAMPGVSTTCNQCSEECAKCTVDGLAAGTCTECAPGYFSTTSSGERSCTKCDPICGTCGTTADHCFICGTGYYDDKSGPTGIPNCVTCGIVHCDKCTETGVVSCNACKPGYFLSSNACVRGCDDSCLTCSDGTSIGCLTCRADYFYTAIVTPFGTCTACSSIDPNCAQCSDATTCTKCADNYYLASPTNCSQCRPSNGQGIPNCELCGQIESCIKCATGTFANNGVCTNCTSSCKECDGSKINDCTDCLDNTYYINAGACEKCNTQIGDSHCSECRLDGTCTKCDDGYIYTIIRGMCVERTDHNCSETEYVRDDDTCGSCDPSCVTCRGRTTADCMTCPETYVLVKADVASYYGTCEKCPENCKVCNSTNNCTLCNDNSELTENGTCHRNFGTWLFNGLAIIISLLILL